MSDATKASIQSFIRAGLNALAGAWMIKHPDMGGIIEGLILNVIALVWTWFDNRAKNPPEPPTKITMTLGCILFALSFSGCASNFNSASKEWKYQDGQPVLTSIRQYDNGQLVKEEIYTVFPPVNAPTEWRASNRALALADSRNELNKAKGLTTDKTVSAGWDQASQETKSTVVPDSIKAIGDALPSLISPVPVP